MVLLRTPSLVQQDRCHSVPNPSRRPPVGSWNNKRKTRRGAQTRLRSGRYGTVEPRTRRRHPQSKRVQKVGNAAFTANEARSLWQIPDLRTLKRKRDRAILAVLLGCGLRRAELTELTVAHLQRREEHWAIVDLVGKGGHIRTVPVPVWVKQAIDEWLAAARVTEGKIFRRVCRTGMVWGTEMTEKVVWYIVKQYAEQLGISKLAPHDLRRSCARLCHTAGGELEQIQFLPSHGRTLRKEIVVGLNVCRSSAIEKRQQWRK